MAMSYPEARQLVGELIVEKLAGAPADAVGGLALGAWPIALAVSDAAWRLSSRTIRTFVVRKEPKDHGTGKFIEGDVKAGDRAIIVDDVVTTGMSTVTAIERCRAAGLEVARIFAIVDRQESGGRENLGQQGVPFEVLFTLADLRARAE
jgi:orotate phosphoribosyltransferase